MRYLLLIIFPLLFSCTKAKWDIKSEITSELVLIDTTLNSSLALTCMRNTGDNKFIIQLYQTNSNKTDLLPEAITFNFTDLSTYTLYYNNYPSHNRLVQYNITDYNQVAVIMKLLSSKVIKSTSYKSNKGISTAITIRPSVFHNSFRLLFADLIDKYQNTIVL